MKIKCPFCNENLNLINKSYICINKHSLDLSKSGYLNTNTSSKNSGDNREMIEARINFLEDDCYLPLKDELNKIIGKYSPSNLLDLACGEGYYTKDFKAKEKFGIDLSKAAIAYASKKDKSTQYLIGSIFKLPFYDDSFDLITTIFAPLAKDEIIRTLKGEGIFIFVLPNENHLVELKKHLYDRVYLNKNRDEIEGLNLLEKHEVSYTFTTNKVLDLLKMTPYYYKTPKKAIENIKNINTLKVRADFKILVYKKENKDGI